MACELLIVVSVVHILALDAVSLLGCVVALGGAPIGHDGRELSPCPSCALM